MKLEGVKVLDLSLFLPGPMLTLTMADHGADVIKVEPAALHGDTGGDTGGEPTRDIGYRQNGVSVWFRNTHRGKRSVQLDLKSEAGLKVFWSLAREADVIVEAFRPGVVDRLGVGYEAVKAVNPRVVYCSISAFGQDGPYRDRPAHDLAVQALAGIVHLTEGFDGKPAPPGLVASDALASLYALSAVMMALYRREKTGRGDYIDVAMLDSLLAWTPNVSGRIFATGQPHVPKTERSFGGQAMNAIYETSDGKFVVLGGSEVKFARNLLEPLGRADLVAYAALPPGLDQKPLKDYLTGLFLSRTQAEWVAWFEGRDICFAPVRTLKDAFDDPAAMARGMLTHDREGNAVVGTPIKFRDEPAGIDPTVPELDQHGRQIAAAGWTEADFT